MCFYCLHSNLQKDKLNFLIHIAKQSLNSLLQGLLIEKAKWERKLSKKYLLYEYMNDNKVYVAKIQSV